MAGGRKNRKCREEMVRAAADIVTRHDGFIRGVIRFQNCSRFDEEDVFQEFFLMLIRKPVPPDVRCLRSYLYRAIVHHVVDRIRHQVNYRRNLKKYAEQIRIPINNRSVRNALPEDGQRDAALAYMVRHLREREAQAFMLKYRDNCSIGEIAARMGVERRTVSRYLSEGLKRLQRTLAIE